MDIKKSAKTFIYGCVKYGISAVARCLPIKKKLIILRSFPDFSDNAWALYSYIRANRKDLDVYWVINPDSKVPEYVDKSKVIIPEKNHIRFQWMINRAKGLFHTHGMAAPIIKPRHQVNISLSHGGCPIKKGKGQKVKRRISILKKVKNGTPYDYILCRGEGAVSINAVFWQVDERKILPLGMARDDFFIKNIGEGFQNPLYNGHSKKLIIWMPTFRLSIVRNISETNSATESGLPLFEHEHQVKRLNDFLSKIDVQLMIKIHPLQVENPLFHKSFSNITFVSNQTLDSIGKQTYEVIGYSDALITDYSSVSFDYLITDHPVAYILDDIEKYRKDRGFLFDDPLEVMPGHHIYNIDQFHQFIIDVINSEDNYTEQRKKIRDTYVGEIPECTAKRVLDYFNI